MELEKKYKENNYEFIIEKIKYTNNFKCNLKFLNWSENSQLFFIYCLVIKNIITDKKINIENKIYSMIEKISNIIINGISKIIREGIRKIIENTKIKECDLTLESNYYKKFNNALQGLNYLYKSQRTYKYLLPFIEISKENFLSKKILNL